MAELRQILSLWREALHLGDEVCLAAVVGVDGSSYRKPGARMLFTSAGKRAGTVSGGCLEAEIQRKGWWHTAAGSSLQSYSSALDEDADTPFGLGCGGTVHVLLERGEVVHALLSALERGQQARIPVVSVMRFDAEASETVLVACGDDVLFADTRYRERAEQLGRAAMQSRCSIGLEKATGLEKSGRMLAEYVPPPTALIIVGAGDDAKPLVEFAHQLGWHTTVADGRSHLATKVRFPRADALIPGVQFERLRVTEDDAVVILSHSFEQDRAALRHLLAKAPAYLGLLGARHRTQLLVQQVAPLLGLTAETCLARMHAPVGLDIGATDPATIALAICAEVQSVLHKRRMQQHLQTSPACA